ncbi:MAG: energy-coupling factor transporter transmembrane component T [Thermodesulfovibrionales bacterium]
MPPDVKPHIRPNIRPEIRSDIRPDIRIILYLVFAVSLYVIKNLSVFYILSGILIFFLLRVPFKKLKAGWVPITLFLSFTLLSNLFNHHGKVLVAMGSFFITEEGLNAAVFRTLRLFLMIGGLKVLMAGTPTGDLVSALGRLFMPLERLGLPVKDLVHTMGLTLQCFPVLKDMGSELYRKQLALHEGKGFSGRVKVITSFMVPMFVMSVRTPEIFFEKRGEDGKKD